MAGAIQLTEVDFEQIKLNLINYLKSTREFTDYDFSGSNLQVILDLISYQSQLNAYSTNMIANESFLASATIRDNVVANARSVGYIPTSARAAESTVNFNFQLIQDEFPEGYPSFVELKPGMAFSVNNGKENFIFNAIEPATASVANSGLASFTNVSVFEGSFLEAEFVVDTADFDQRYVLPNKGIDISTIRVEVQPIPNEDYTVFFGQANNYVEVGPESNVYWVEEINEEKYVLTFGDGLFGRELKNGARIKVTYVVTNGAIANGISTARNFAYVGQIVSSNGVSIRNNADVVSASLSRGGANIESVQSVKFRAPRYYAAQNRAVVTDDYATLVKQIYPAIDDIYVYGGEELDIPEYGRVFIVIKPTSGAVLSNSAKNYIVQSLNEYRVASLQVLIQDPDILYIEVDTVAFYNDKNTLKDGSGVASEVRRVLSSYFIEGAIDKFGGAARFSRIVSAIDGADPSIVRNLTTMRMRKDFAIIPNAPSSYEICFEQALSLNTNTSVIYSTGFQLIIDGFNDGRTYYFEDDTNGTVYLFYFDDAGSKIVKEPNFGTVDYTNGEVMLGYTTPIIFVSTVELNNIIKIRANPFAQDIVAKKSVYLDLDVDSSRIDAVIDTNIQSS